MNAMIRLTPPPFSCALLNIYNKTNKIARSFHFFCNGSRTSVHDVVYVCTGLQWTCSSPKKIGKKGRNDKTTAASLSLELNAIQFQNGVKSQQYDFVNTNQVCLDTCCSAPQDSFSFFLQLNILNKEWTNDYNNLSAPTTVSLQSDIKSMVIAAKCSKFFFDILSPFVKSLCIFQLEKHFHSKNCYNLTQLDVLSIR